MADEIDIANDRAQQDLDLALSCARRHEPALPPTGWCYNCAELLNDDRLFCDRDCRDDYEHRLARNAR
jgi:hypothetical protein